MRMLLVLALAVSAGCGGGRVRHTGSVPPALPVSFVSKPEAVAPEIMANPTPIAQADPAPAREPTPPPRLSLSELVAGANAQLRDIFFAYDSFTLDASATGALEFNHSVLRPLLSDFPKLEVVIEGHCDERGSAEYNLGLGDFRAKRALDFLRQLGLASANLRTVSYGREKPQCTGPGEECWSRNRRAHLFVEAPR